MLWKNRHTLLWHCPSQAWTVSNFQPFQEKQNKIKKGVLRFFMYVYDCVFITRVSRCHLRTICQVELREARPMSVSSRQGRKVGDLQALAARLVQEGRRVRVLA